MCAGPYAQVLITGYVISFVLVVKHVIKTLGLVLVMCVITTTVCIIPCTDIYIYILASINRGLLFHIRSFSVLMSP